MNEQHDTPPNKWPPIPSYLTDPIVFLDKNMGICMVATTSSGQQWVFREHDGHWCSERPTSKDDPLLIQPLNVPAAPESSESVTQGAREWLENLPIEEKVCVDYQIKLDRWLTIKPTRLIELLDSFASYSNAELESALSLEIEIRDRIVRVAERLCPNPDAVLVNGNAVEYVKAIVEAAESRLAELEMWCDKTSSDRERAMKYRAELAEGLIQKLADRLKALAVTNHWRKHGLGSLCSTIELSFEMCQEDECPEIDRLITEARSLNKGRL